MAKQVKRDPPGYAVLQNAAQCKWLRQVNGDNFEGRAGVEGRREGEGQDVYLAVQALPPGLTPAWLDMRGL